MDVVAAIRTYLLADATVASISGGRLYGGELDKDEEPNQPRAAAVLRRSGGGLMGRSQLYGDRRIDLICYGANPKEASDLFDACRDALKALQRHRDAATQVLIHWAVVSVDGVSGHDPQTAWPICIGSFQVLAADIAAS